MRKRIPLMLVTVSVLVLSAAAPATVYELTPADNWYSVVSGSGLQPGDEVILHGGVYSTSSWLPVEHQGTAANPIIIRAADGETPIITKTSANKNNMDIRGARYLILRGLEFTGADAAIRIQKNSAGQHAKFITIEDCHIHHTGGNAITANHTGQTYEGMIFRRNHIHHVSGHGEGFYLGSNYNGSQFYDGIIEQNFIHDLIPDSGIFQGDGIEIKDGSYNNIVRDNVIVNTNYPGIIVYGTAGQGGPNIIERNVIIGSGDNGIQAAADAIVRNNIVIDAAWDGIHSHHHQSAVPGNLEIYHNTIISPGSGRAVYVSGASGLAGPVTVANNALYGGSISLPGGTTSTGNVNASAADFENLGSWNVFPADGSSLIGAANPAYVVEHDFNGTPRAGALDVGAYVYSPNGNPGWIITSDFKVFPIPPGDANKDGVVNVQDLSVLATNWEKDPAAWDDGNFNSDSVVNVQDLSILATNWGSGAVGAAVPEPATLLLLAAAGGFLLRREGKSTRAYQGC